MHYRRLASLILGAWIAGTLFMMYVATQNFSSVDRLMASPSAQAAKQIEAMGKQQARAFLRYQAAEQNRWFFEGWERVQLGLGVLLFLTLFFGAGARPSMLILSLMMLVAVGVMHWFLTPEIVRLGQAMDFAPQNTTSPHQSRFWGFHLAYTLTDTFKTGLGFVLAIRLLRRRRRSADLDEEFDAINDADHSHIDR